MFEEGAPCPPSSEYMKAQKQQPAIITPCPAPLIFRSRASWRSACSSAAARDFYGTKRGGCPSCHLIFVLDKKHPPGFVRLPILLVVSRTGKMNVSLSPLAPENLVSIYGFVSPVPRQPAHLHARTESYTSLQVEND